MAEVYAGFMAVCCADVHLCESSQNELKCPWNTVTMIITVPLIYGAMYDHSLLQKTFFLLWRAVWIYSSGTPSVLLETRHHALWPACITEMILLSLDEHLSDSPAFSLHDCTQDMLFAKQQLYLFRHAFLVCFRVGPM